MATPQERESPFFLPNFCSLRSVFAVVVLAQLFAFILTLANATTSRDPLEDLALTSLFMQWAGLVSAALLCLLRRPLARLGSGAAGVVSYLLLLLVITLLSQITYLLLEHTELRLITLSQGEFLLRNLAIGAIVMGLMLRYLYVAHQWRQRIRAEAQARLQALQARIRPHFLFNSINTVSSLIHSRPDAAEEALLDLADLFRASLREEQRLIPLAEELELTRRYLAMEALRLGERLEVAWEVEGGLEAVQLPPLLLQPLVENAVYHGIEPRPAGGRITIRAARDRQGLLLQVNNPLPDPGNARASGNRMALDNIRLRLAAHYGERAVLRLEEEGGEFRVTLTLPLEERTE